MTVTTVSTSAALLSALKVAKAGDTIQVAPGNYAALNISALNFATDVTITSLDPGHRAVFAGLGISRISGLTVTNLEFAIAPGASGLAVASSSDVHLDNLYVHGTLDGNPQNDAGGLLLRDSSNVSISNSTFEQLHWAIQHTNVQGLVIADNSIHDIRMDGIRGGGSSNVQISGNELGDFYPASGDHSDAIQFWTSNTTTSAHDIIVKDNVFMRGGGAMAQGVFMGDEVGNLPYLNVQISGNLVSGGLWNAIYVGAGQGVTITDNIVQAYPGITSWIYLGKVTDGHLVNNTTNKVVTTAQTQFTEVGTTIVPVATDQGAAAYAQWTQMHGAPPAGVHLIGSAMADTLTGGAGGDTLQGGGGADILTGGAGDDVYVTSSTVQINESAGDGADTVRSNASVQLQANVENAELTLSGNAWATGNALDNRLTGNAGANRIDGQAGADTLSAGAANDTVVGGVGDDDLTGGAGTDTFTFAQGSGRDVIRDFGVGGEHDVINVSAFLAKGLSATLTDAAGGVTISFSASDQIYLPGIHIADLHANPTGWVF